MNEFDYHHPLTPTRRGFLTACAMVSASTALTAQKPNPMIPIIDTHIHLFDPTRPQGAPYTGPAGKPPQIALPPRYRHLAEPLGIVGAIKVEASPWVEDNLWALQVAADDPMVVGVVGNLRPEHPDFTEFLGRYRKHPLFRGIRYGNLWNYDLPGQSRSPQFLDRLALLADAGLVLDTANPDMALLEAVLRVNDRLPKLHVVIDHLPKFEPTPDEHAGYERLLAEFRERSKVFVKLSSVIHPINGNLSHELVPYRERLDQLIDVFGEDRVIFGSDWPNSDGVAPIERVVGIVKEYFAARDPALAEKYFWRNSLSAYNWVPRDEIQKRIAGDADNVSQHR